MVRSCCSLLLHALNSISYSDGLNFLPKSSLCGKFKPTHSLPQMTDLIKFSLAASHLPDVVMKRLSLPDFVYSTYQDYLLVMSPHPLSPCNLFLYLKKKIWNFFHAHRGPVVYKTDQRKCHQSFVLNTCACLHAMLLLRQWELQVRGFFRQTV